MSFFVIVVAFLSSVVSLVSGCNVQVYKPNIGPMCGVFLLSRLSGVSLIRVSLVLFSGRLL